MAQDDARKLVSDGVKLLILATGTVALVAVRLARGAREVADHLEDERFHFTVRGGQIYWRRTLINEWVGVNEPDMHLADRGTLYVPLAVATTGGVPHFSRHAMDKVAALFGGDAYGRYRKDQDTLDLMGDPAVFATVVPEPTAEQMRATKEAVKAARSRRENRHGQFAETERHVRDTFGLDHDHPDRH